MFGKGGGPLNAWIKEFCELVFIQTLQAFIFAIVISFVVNLSATNIADDGDRNAAYGIICIVALTSIFKVEDIARRIFGYGPTKADHGNAVQSIGKSMMALRMGKNLLDNGKKIVGGAGAWLGAKNQKTKAYKRANARMAALNKDNGMDTTNSALQSGNIEVEASENKTVNVGSTGGKANVAEATHNAQVAVNTAKAGKSGNIKDYNQKRLQIEEELNDKISDINKRKRQGIKQMVSGVAESGAALVGFTAGTAMSVASTNDWGGAVKDGITWAGTADAVTAGAIDLGFAGTEFIGNRARDLSKMRSEKQGYLTKAKQEYVENYISQVNAQTKQYNEAVEKDEQAAKEEVKEAVDTINKQVSSKKDKELTPRQSAREQYRQNHSLSYQKTKFEGNKSSDGPSKSQINKAYKQVKIAEKTGKPADIDRNVFK